MNDFSVKAIDRNILENLDLDHVIAFSYAEKDARRFSGMIDIAVYDGTNFTFYFGNYLDGELSIKDYAKVFLPLMRSLHLESHFRKTVPNYAKERNTSFDGVNYSLGTFSRTWMHYTIGDCRHLFINRKQDVYVEELAAAVSENIAQTNVVPTIATQIGYINQYWRKAIADIFENEDDKYNHPNHIELRHILPRKMQFVLCDNNTTYIINESNKQFRAYETEVVMLGPDAQDLLNGAAAENQSQLVGDSGIELDYFFHSEYFHFISPDWIHISLGDGKFILIRPEYFDQAMRLCNYYRRQDLYEAIADGQGMHDDGLRYLFDYYWRICALRLAPGSKPFTKSFQEHLEQLPLTQHAYNTLQLESTVNKSIDLHKIVDLANLVNTYLDDIPEEIYRQRTYQRHDIIMSAAFLCHLSQHKFDDIEEVYGKEVADLVMTVRKFKHEKPESLSLSESLLLAADIVRGLNDDFENCEVADLYRKSILKGYLEQISFIISDRNKLPYATEGEFASRNALWFSQIQILQMRLDYLLDN